MTDRAPANGAANASTPPTRLARKLGVGDAVVIGLGSMVGAGIFSALGPAARAAGSGLVPGLVVAAFVAWCNATSSAALAALYPESGGTYVYGRKRLNAFWGFVADVRAAIGFSSFAVLVYYAIANASALTLRPFERRWPRWLAGAGLGGSVLLAFSLPLTSMLAGGALFVFGAAVYAARHRAG